MSRRAQRGNRDTAKDIILGLAPSGQGPRAPKEGVAFSPKVRSRSYDAPSRSSRNERFQRSPQPPPPPPPPPPQPRNDDRAIQRLQGQLQQMQLQNRELLSAEKAARRRLEANQDALQRRLVTSESGIQPRDLDEIRRYIGNVDAKLLMMNNDISGLRNAVDRQVNDLMHINNEIKNRPQVDPSKLSNTTAQLDGKMRDLHGQLMELKQQLGREKYDREKDNKTASESIARLQDIIRQQDQAKSDVLNSLTRKGEVDKEKLTEEAKRLNDKINLITSEVTKKLGENQARLKDDLGNRVAGLEMLIRTQNERIAEAERELRLNYDNRMNDHAEQLGGLAKQFSSEKAKQKERFQKVNEALAALEHHLELGNSKIDKLMNSEIQARKQHEKGLLSKMTDVEDKLNHYINGMNKSIEDVRMGKENVSVPSLDTDALRREMEAISADKNKLSMEGLLKLEEKMSRVQQGFYHDRKEISSRITELGDGDHVSKLRAQVNKLDSIQEDMEKTQDRIRDKVERQIPQDLNELSAKADNIKHQLSTRLDREEEERYLAIKELQEAFAHLPAAGQGARGVGTDPQMKRDVDECKIAVKKLAESVTTVKNVLDRKITDESQKRETEISQLRRQMSSQ